MDEVRALVLSGGGSKGSYQAGVVDYLLRDLGMRYQILAGVSVGAINTTWLAHFPDGEEAEAATELVKFWEGISTEKVRKRWFWGDLSVLWKPSRYNSKPLRNYLASRIDPERVRTSGKQLFVGAVSLDSGRFEAFTEQTEPLLDAVLASASYPAMLLPVRLCGELWTDGGVRNVTPLSCAIEAGATAVDVVMCTPKHKSYSDLDPDPNALDILQRAVSIMTDEVIETDVALALAYNELAVHDASRRHVNIRIVRPSEGLGVSSLDFNREDMLRLLENGRTDAREQT